MNSMHNQLKPFKKNDKKMQAIGYAILAALLYGISSPFSKLLLKEIPPTLIAALLYLGAGFGMLAINVFKTLIKSEPLEARMTQKEIPFIVGMILLDIIAPILLMLGLTKTTAANASLLNNFEIVATAVIALFIFKETIGKRLWIAIVLIITSSMLLSITDLSSFSFSWGSILVLLACISWGFENNCTRMLSLKNPTHIVVIKGFGSGLGSLIISFFMKDARYNWLYIFFALFLGFVAYGMSIFFYIKAQRELGAARTSTFYAAAPFIGVLVSWIFLKESITTTFVIALLIMLLGTYFAISEKHRHAHKHTMDTHEHKHNHYDGHHNHNHQGEAELRSEHSHEHTHENMEHSHSHFPDQHHQHKH